MYVFLTFRSQTGALMRGRGRDSPNPQLTSPLPKVQRWQTKPRVLMSRTSNGVENRELWLWGRNAQFRHPMENSTIFFPLNWKPLRENVLI